MNGLRWKMKKHKYNVTTMPDILLSYIEELEDEVDMLALDNGKLLITIVELRHTISMFWANRNDPGEREA